LADSPEEEGFARHIHPDKEVSGAEIADSAASLFTTFLQVWISNRGAS